MIVAPVVIAVLAIAAAGVAAAGAIQAGQAQKKIGKFNAELARREAKRAREVAAFKEKQLREEGAAFRSKQIAAAASQGRDVNEGSPLLLRQETAEDIELDALSIRFQGSAEAARLEGEARLHKFRGKQAQTASFFKAGSTLLGGAASAAGAFSGGGGSTTSFGVNATRISAANLNGDT